MKVIVLLSTWNGSKYLRQQIDSILAQTVDGDMEVLVRDDGSKDDTVKIVEEMNDGRIHLIRGKNLGAKGSFMALIGEAMHGNADYFAFADQDDYWLPGKLQRAVEELGKAGGPALYCSALNLVDDALQPLDSYRLAGVIGFEAAFLTNCATGCTCVMNRDLLAFLAERPEVGNIMMHDWWLYLVAAAFGKVLYDHESHILYRQHAGNQIGMQTGMASLLSRARRLTKRSVLPSRFSQAREFQRIYGDRLPVEKQRYLEKLLSCERNTIARIRYFFTLRPRRNSLMENIASSFTFLIGR